MCISQCERSLVSILVSHFMQHDRHVVFTILHLGFRYPADLRKRAQIDCILDWHHTNLRHGAGKDEILFLSLNGGRPSQTMLKHMALNK